MMTKAHAAIGNPTDSSSNPINAKSNLFNGQYRHQEGV